jgi:hypothetical protein
MRKSTRDRYYAELDKVFSGIEGLASNIVMSQKIHNYFSRQFVSFFYASLISNIFDNLNKANARKHRLSTEEITAINKSYAKIIGRAKSGLELSLKQHELIDEAYYKNFKTDLSKRHPDSVQPIAEIEKAIDMNKARKYLKDKQYNLKSAGKSDPDLQALLLTKEYEKHIESKDIIPTEAELNTLTNRIFSKESLDPYVKKIYKNLKKSASQVLEEQRTIRLGFEDRLYRTWREPLDLLESLIIISLENGMAKNAKLVKARDKSNIYKRDALIRIHARGIKISREIFVLLNSGYADGANARWRSLDELAGIALFLHESSNDVARRYLDHQIMKIYRDAKEFQIYCKTLGYTPFSTKQMKTMENKRVKLQKLHGSDFGKQDYEWIPKAIVSDCNFKALAKHVHIDQLNPYYNMSSNAVHGGSRALFYQLGLPEYRQGKTLLAGPTNLGLADPIQGTAISLNQISCSLLGLESDVEDIIAMRIMEKYLDEIGPVAVGIQKQIEKEEMMLPKHSLSSTVKKP